MSAKRPLHMFQQGSPKRHKPAYQESTPTTLHQNYPHTQHQAPVHHGPRGEDHGPRAEQHSTRAEHHGTIAEHHPSVFPSHTPQTYSSNNIPPSSMYTAPNGLVSHPRPPLNLGYNPGHSQNNNYQNIGNHTQNPNQNNRYQTPDNRYKPQNKGEDSRHQYRQNYGPSGYDDKSTESSFNQIAAYGANSFQSNSYNLAKQHSGVSGQQFHSNIHPPSQQVQSEQMQSPALPQQFQQAPMHQYSDVRFYNPSQNQSLAPHQNSVGDPGTQYQASAPRTTQQYDFVKGYNGKQGYSSNCPGASTQPRDNAASNIAQQQYTLENAPNKQPNKRVDVKFVNKKVESKKKCHSDKKRMITCNIPAMLHWAKLQHDTDFLFELFVCLNSVDRNGGLNYELQLKDGENHTVKANYFQSSTRCTELMPAKYYRTVGKVMNGSFNCFKITEVPYMETRNAVNLIKQSEISMSKLILKINES